MTHHQSLRRYYFEFRDIVVLRIAERLLAAGYGPQQAQSILQAIKSQMGQEPLSSVAVDTSGSAVIARDAQGIWEPESRQCCFGFDAEAPPAVKLPAAHEHELTAAEDWFEEGLKLEPDHPELAYECYLTALACNPEHVESYINLGRLCSAREAHQRALAFCRMALRLDPKQPVAHFNMGVILHDLGQHEAAHTAYLAALAIDTDFMDVHFNLATLYAELGQDDAAASHHAQFEDLRRPS